LEDNELVAVSLAGLGMTGLFVLIVNLWIWGKEKEIKKKKIAY